MTLKINITLVFAVFGAINAFTVLAAEQIDPATCAANFIILEKSAKASGQTEKSDVLKLMLASAYADSFDKYGDQIKPVVQRELKKYRSLIDDKGTPSPSFERTMATCINLYSKRAGLEE